MTQAHTRRVPGFVCRQRTTEFCASGAVRSLASTRATPAWGRRARMIDAQRAHRNTKRVAAACRTRQGDSRIPRGVPAEAGRGTALASAHEAKIGGRKLREIGEHRAEIGGADAE